MYAPNESDPDRVKEESDEALQANLDKVGESGESIMLEDFHAQVGFRIWGRYRKGKCR
jgi:hypothetical protein